MASYSSDTVVSDRPALNLRRTMCVTEKGGEVRLRNFEKDRRGKKSEKIVASEEIAFRHHCVLGFLNAVDENTLLFFFFFRRRGKGRRRKQRK